MVKSCVVAPVPSQGVVATAALSGNYGSVWAWLTVFFNLNLFNV